MALPSLPPHLSYLLDQSIDTEFKNEVALIDYVNIKKYLNDPTVAEPYKYTVDTKIVEWLDENIITNMPSTITRIANGSNLAPHIDRFRNYTLIYVHRSGGENVEIKLFQEIGKPIVRDERGLHVNDRSRLSNLATVHVTPGSWYLLNAKILHSVENLTSDRWLLQVDFLANATVPDSILEKAIT